MTTPLKCSCGNGFYCDRHIGDRLGCPACDPELGDTPEKRIQNYRILLSTPAPKCILEMFNNGKRIEERE